MASEGRASLAATQRSVVRCDRVNPSAGRVVKTSRRNAKGTTSAPRVVTVGEFGRRFNVWTIKDGRRQHEHPAPFPEALANDHILSWSNPGDLVLDPFVGSGTTGKMAVLNGREFIGNGTVTNETYLS